MLICVTKLTRRTAVLVRHHNTPGVKFIIFADMCRRVFCALFVQLPVLNRESP